MFSKTWTSKSTVDYSQKIERLKAEFQNADAILIGAGSGLSTSAGLTYGGERFLKYFSDFHEKYGITDIYSGGFYPFPSLEEYWATNVDHQFQLAGFDKARLFYTQGDYGLWQCSEPCHQETYDNEATVRRMIAEQAEMRVPSELIPRCPKCGRPMTMNLRCDDTFVQDEGWYVAARRYEDFLHRHKNGRILLLELGVGGNTPGIIKVPFLRMTAQNPRATYACINLGEAITMKGLEAQSILLDADIGAVLSDLR